MAEKYKIYRSEDHYLRKQISEGLDSLSERIGGPDDPVGPPAYDALNMRWRNEWASVQYYTGDTVNDTGWAMVANKDTTDRAAPQDNGSPSWDMPEVPAWADFAEIAIVGSGHTYAFSETVYINSVRVWVPVVGVGIFYRLTRVKSGLYTSVDLLGLIAGEWNVIGVDPRLVVAGEEVLFFLESSNSGADTTVTGGWTRDVNSNVNEPADESWNRNNAGTVLRIDFNDLNSTDRQTELEGIIIGSTITISETAIPSNFTEFHVLANPVTDITSVSYLVAITDSGAADPTIGEPSTVTALVPIAQSTDFVGIINGWVGTEPIYANVTSFLSYDGIDQGVDPDNQYGISINVQRLTISPDWDVLSPGSIGAGETQAFAWEIPALQFRARFTQTEKVDIVKFLNRVALGPLPSWDDVWTLTEFIGFTSDGDVNLTFQYIIDSVNWLETVGIIAPGRAAVILAY
jgi:hypothetical protein